MPAAASAPPAIASAPQRAGAELTTSEASIANADGKMLWYWPALRKTNGGSKGTNTPSGSIVWPG